MDERSKKRIREHLQDTSAQERIQRYMEKGRAEATVTISRASELFQLSENRLRDWEEFGLLSPLRPTGPKGRRLYTPGELDKLAIIRELLDAGYAPSDIPPDVDLVWHTISEEGEPPLSVERRGLSAGSGRREKSALSIPPRIDRARTELYWRYFVSRALRFALMLICEDIPHTTSALILPLEPPVPVETIQSVDDCVKLGESLIGWLDQGRFSHTLLVSAPTFDYATDYRLLPLATMTEDRVEEAPQGNTLILLDRRSRRLTLTAPMVTTIRQLLRPIYEDVQRSRSCFDAGMRDVLEPSTDLENMSNDEDITLNGLAEAIVKVGGTTEYEEPRWKFCCVLLPNYPSSVLSLQQRALVVRAQSSLSPYKVGVTAVHPLGSAIGPCLRAFQSGHIISQPVISVEDLPLAHTEENSLTRNEENERIRSAIAVPVDGQDGMSIAVIYVAALTPHAFSESDQRVLRLMGNMVGELLETYSIRLRPMGKLRDIISAPGCVDPLFRDFLSENDFARHVEGILRDVMDTKEEGPKDVASFIAIDIDNQSSLANKYGDRMARDISRAVGLRILGQLRAFKDEGRCEFYRIHADRFYLVLQGISLEQACARAELLRKVLKGSYQIDPQRAPIGQPTLPENMVTLSNITVRLAVSSYFYSKLKEILQRYSTENAIVEARLLLMRFLDEGLDIGKRAGGDRVMSWDPHNRGIVPLSSMD
jgi:GGDEF domain-containing protein/GAF domain-containing protein